MPLLFGAIFSSAWPLLSQSLCQCADHSLVLLGKLTLFERFATLAHQGWLNWPSAAHGVSYLGWFAVIAGRLRLWRTHYWSLGVLSLVSLVPLLGRDQERRVDLLDVGHGLAVVISRQGRAILYDVGTAWPGGSVAERSIIPHLQWRRLALEGVILSHQDRDHAGGWPVIQQRYPQIWLRSAAIQTGAWPCRAGEHWRWQGLYFEVLWPPKLVPRAYNRDSCTLRVSDGQHQVLLTGDLERSAEWRLVREKPQQLTATVLLVPHHGSRTSSSETLLSAVKPQAAIVSAARYNPWRLPAAVIQNRYQQQGIAWFSTAQGGQITLRFTPSGWKLLTYRHHLAPRWYHPWWGVASTTG
jgi:competence protein ComEC